MASKRKSVPKAKREATPHCLRVQLWERYFTFDVGRAKCPVCNMNHILQLAFEAGHIVSVAKGGKTTIDNLVPICRECNRSMGTKNMIDFQKTHYPKAVPIKILQNPVEKTVIDLRHEDDWVFLQGEQKQTREEMIRQQEERYRELQEEATLRKHWKYNKRHSSDISKGTCFFCYHDTDSSHFNFHCCDIYAHGECVTVLDAKRYPTCPMCNKEEDREGLRIDSKRRCQR